MPVSRLGNIVRLAEGDVASINIPRKVARKVMRASLAVGRLARCGVALNRRASIVDPASDVTVSLTSFGERLHSVHWAIGSIISGSERPRAIVLWLAPDDAIMAEQIKSLRRLARRGLTISTARDDGPHKKYWPAVERRPSTSWLVTADDDILYPRRWLAGLLDGAQPEERTVRCWRAKIVRTDGESRLRPYNRWTQALESEPAVDVFATGASGVMYPASMLDALAAAGEGFRTSAPRADDIWLHHTAVVSGHRVQQVGQYPRLFSFLPGSQSSGLVIENVAGFQNDRQAAATYRPAAIGAIYEANQNRAEATARSRQ